LTERERAEEEARAAHLIATIFPELLLEEEDPQGHQGLHDFLKLAELCDAGSETTFYPSLSLQHG
jgi:hypothetical protein